MSYANPEDEWFPYTDDFNKTPDSPGAANQFNFEAGNIDNIPLNDDGPLSPGANLEFDLGANLDDYQFGDTLRLSPNNGSNGQQPGTSGQYQNMHLMQSNDTFDQHMQPSTSVAYNSFEMPTVVNSNLDVGPYQDLGIEDPNSFYASQQPSTSMANDMNMSDSYEMMGQSSSTYMPQIDQMAGPSSVSNQSQPMQQDVIQAAPKPKSKKRQPPKKKPNNAVETVGTVLTKANKFSQQVENAGVEGSGEGKVEAKLTAEDSMQVGALLSEVSQLRYEQDQGNTDPQLATRIDELQSRIVLLFSKSGGATAAIVSTLQSQTTSAQPANAAPAPKKNPSSKKRSNHQKTVQQSQPPSVQQQPQQKLMMDPPTTTLVPSGSGYNGASNENYAMYQPMDQQGTSQQQYVDYQQPGSQEQMQLQQPIQAKVVPSMNSRTHNYRQSVVFNSQTANVTPSPHQVEQIPDQYQEGSSQQMYVPQNQQQQQQLDDRPMYQPQQQQEAEPTLGDVVRQTQGRYQGPQDAPNLRQQLLTNVNATGKQMLQSSTPTPSPGNLQNNNTMQYGEMQQHSYPQSLEPHHSQQNYEQEYENVGEYCGAPDEQMQMQYQQQDMYMDPMMDPHMQYQQIPEVPPEMSEEELEKQAEELRQSRSMRLKKLMLDQLNQLDAPVDVTPFRGRLDIFQRMLPFHHYTSGEEPVDNFDAHFQRSMAAACVRTKAIGNRIRNIVLRDSMRSSTEWEENMLRFLETENERRDLEEDKALAEQNRTQFLTNSAIVRGLLTKQINLEQTRLRVPPVPAHHHELDVHNGQLSTLYKEYEFDSNRPKDPPTAFIYEEPESESEPEEEVENKKEEVPEPISDLSPLAGFPQISPAVSPDRSRNESESTCEWKDDDESPLLSPETKAAEEIRREVFGTDEDLDKSEPFPFEQLRQKALDAHANVASTSHPADSVFNRKSTSPKPVQQPRTRFPSPVRSVPVPVMPVAPIACQPSTSSAPRAAREVSGSPDIDETFVSPRLKAEEIAPIALPVPVHKIKKEKEEMPKLPKLSIRVPVFAYQKGIEIAASGDEEEPSTSTREPLKLKIKFGRVKVEEPSPESSPRPVPQLKSPARALEPKITPPLLKQLEKPVFKTPLSTPIKATTTGSGDRKRRSEKMEARSESSKKSSKEIEKKGLVTPKNGVVEERFLRTMTDGRKITMKIGNIPRNINHFVTPRRDGKGNIMKNLTPTKDTRLKMIFRRRSGKLSVEVIEKKPEANGEPEKKKKKEDVPNGQMEPQPTGRLDPASRKGSVDEKKKSTAIFMNRFNPFAKLPGPSSTSVPATPSVTPKSTAAPATKSTSSFVLKRPTFPATTQPVKSTAPVALTTPPTIRRPAPISAPITTTPMIPKMAIPNAKTENATPDQPKAPEPKKLSAFLPWLSDNDESPEGKVKIPSTSAAAGAMMASTSSAPSTSSAYLTVKTEPMEPEPTASSATAQESPRATSSMSMIMFDDTGPNGFPLFNLHSPKRTNEPLPRVEFSDDEENELAHSTFSQATDHLLNTSSLNPSWSRDP